MDGTQVIAVVGIVFGTLGGIAGTWLGWKLSKSLALEVAQLEREHQEKQAVRGREEVAAELLRDAVIEAQISMPTGRMNASDAREPLLGAGRGLRMAWTRASVLRDEAIRDRFSTLDMAIFISSQDLAGAKDKAVLNFWALGEAVVELRRALDAFLLREPAPNFDFPEAKELVEIAGSTGVGIDKIHRALVERKVVS